MCLVTIDKELMSKMKDKLVMFSYVRFKKQNYTIFNATTRQRIQDLFGVILFLEREKRFHPLLVRIVCDYHRRSLMFTFSSSLVFLATSRVRKGFYSRQQNLKKEKFDLNTFIIELSFEGSNKSLPSMLRSDLEKIHYLISRVRKQPLNECVIAINIIMSLQEMNL